MKFPTPSLITTLSALLSALWLAGCAPLAQSVRPDTETAATAEATAGDPDEVAEVEPTPAQLPGVELTPQLLYRFLLAEVATQRGQFAGAAELYLGLASETRDPRLARRATEIAMHGRRLDMALQSARLWRETEPGSVPARQAYIGLMAAQGQYDELRPEIAALLAEDTPRLRGNLANLNRLFVRGGDRKAIQALINQVTAPYPGMAEAHFARAIAAYEAQDKATGLPAARRALELRPDWETAALLRAQLTEDREEALAELGSFIAAHPKAREARMAYGRALVAEKRYVEARKEFNALLELTADDPGKNGDVIFAIAALSLQLNDTAVADQHLRKLVESDHAEADKARYYLGQMAEDSQRWDEALKWFDAVRRGEHYLNARLHAANLLMRQGKVEAARQYLAGSEASGARDRSQLLIGEAQMLRDADRIEDAHRLLATALEQQPDQPDLLYEIALLAERLGRVDELETRLRRLIELKPDHAHALNALGFSFAERNIRLPEARDLIDRALELAPEDPFILDSKGWVLYRQGEHQAALDVLNQAFGIRPDPEIAAHLGEVLWTLGRRDEARGTWEKALKASPKNDALLETVRRLAP